MAETVINILCEVWEHGPAPADAEPRVVKAVLREHGQRAAIASEVFCALINGAAAAGNEVTIRPFAKAAVQSADILLEALNG